MRIFETEGRKCISINGKDYFLLRGYEKNYGKYIFLQVMGNTALHKEDMPTKDWEIITSKSNGEKVWTAYTKNYFKYDSEKQSFAFLGATTTGSYFLALKHISKKFNITIEDKEILKVAKQYSENKKGHHCLDEYEDKGNSGEKLVMFEFGNILDDRQVLKILGLEKERKENENE